MNRGKVAIFVLIAVIVLAVGAAVPLLAAKPRRGVYGGVWYTMVTGPNPENRHPAGLMFNVTELNKNGKAKGDYFFWAQHQQAGFIAIQAKVTCIEFLGDGVAEVSGRVVWRMPPVDYDCSDFFTVRLVDAGTPGSAGDAGAYYMSPCEATSSPQFGFSCNPCGGKTCGEGTLSPLFPIEQGDIIIRE